MKKVNLLFKVLRFLVTLPILIYQKVISPMFPGNCIYHPTCSEYSKRSIQKHGIFKGLFLGFMRIFRCVGGLFSGGEDYVPDKFVLKEVFIDYKRFWHGKKKNKKKPKKKAELEDEPRK